jgi:hypothetical protein
LFLTANNLFFCVNSKPNAGTAVVLAYEVDVGGRELAAKCAPSKAAKAEAVRMVAVTLTLLPSAELRLWTSNPSPLFVPIACRRRSIDPVSKSRALWSSTRRIG